MTKALIVTQQESNQKIFNFLQRKFDIGMNETHKWIRSGQVRINGKRCTAFDKVKEGDEIRIPPFAVNFEKNKDNLQKNSNKKQEKIKLPYSIIYEDEDLLVIDKACGLAVQSGTKQDISLVEILKQEYTHSSFMPTPAHRLDKDTSGILLIGKSYTMLQALHKALSDKEGKIKKIYLARVENKNSDKIQEGLWEDILYIDKDRQGKEKTFVLDTKNLNVKNIDRKKALSRVKILSSNKESSLLEIEILTGRKHQIRAQCSHRNIPILGDLKYGGKKADRLYLHAYKIEWQGKVFYAEKYF